MPGDEEIDGEVIDDAPDGTADDAADGADEATDESSGDRFELCLEAEDAQILSVFLRVSDPDASGGAFISPLDAVVSSDPSLEAFHTVDLPRTGTYFLWARLMGPSSNEDAIFIGFDENYDRVYPPTTGQYYWVEIEGAGGVEHQLNAGAHVISIGHSEPNVRLDLLCLADHQDVDWIPVDPGEDGGTVEDGDAGVPDDGDGGVPDDGDGSPGRLSAFPGAQGYGALAATGLDRSTLEVLKVINRNDSGPGSLRQAVADADNAVLSIIIFRVGGTITLTSGRISLTGKKNLYIAGQTAPGEGIQLYSDGDTVLESRDSQDVIIRYLRLRSDKPSDDSQVDVVTFVNTISRMIVDHLSVQFGSDEVMSLTTNATLPGPGSDVTWQWTLIGPCFRPHSTGSLIAANAGGGALTNVSLHHNLWISNAHRNPLVHDARFVQIVNNMVYNWRNIVGRINHGAIVDTIKNYWLTGPWSGDPSHILFYEDGTDPPLVYLEGNVADPFQIDPAADQHNLWRNDSTYQLVPSSFISDTRLTDPEIPIVEQTAQQARDSVMASVGASALLDCSGNFIPARDRLDQYLISLAHSGGTLGPSTDEENMTLDDYLPGPDPAANLPDSVSGLLPDVDISQACPDADDDGLPDAWESDHGGNPTAINPEDDADGDGYSNIEEYLNGTAP